MGTSETNKFYKMAVKFASLSDELLRQLKCHVIEKFGDLYQWKSPDNIRIFCRKEWYSGTFIDIYINHPSTGSKIVHLCIDRQGEIHIPLDFFP